MLKTLLKQLDVLVIRVLNKVELNDGYPVMDNALPISAKTGYGVSDLKAMLHNSLMGNMSSTSEIFITRARQRDELKIALSHLEEASESMIVGMADEVITFQLRAAGLAFDRLFGTELASDILDRIFSKFCIGK
jgi:tRNA modification GTPase